MSSEYIAGRGGGGGGGVLVVLVEELQLNLSKEMASFSQRIT